MGYDHKQDVGYQLLGWILFIICAVFFILSGVKNGDMLTLVASLIFLVACMVFLIPLFKTIKAAKHTPAEDGD